MYKCWRRDDASNPETFIDAAAAILADYPDDVIVLVTDPRSGLAGKLKWPAQPSEVKESCEDIHGPTRRRLEREKNEREQLRERAAIERKRSGAKQTYEEVCAEMTERGFSMGSPQRPLVIESDAFCKKYGVSREQFDALPDLPDDHKAWGEFGSLYRSA